LPIGQTGRGTQPFYIRLKDSAPFASAVAEVQKRVGRQRLAKLVAENRGLIAVTYWGGTVFVVELLGSVQGERRLPQDVTALTWSGTHLIVGDADGRVMAFKVK
jgi:hypothetical protein